MSGWNPCWPWCWPHDEPATPAAAASPHPGLYSIFGPVLIHTPRRKKGCKPQPCRLHAWWCQTSALVLSMHACPSCGSRLTTSPACKTGAVRPPLPPHVCTLAACIAMFGPDFAKLLQRSQHSAWHIHSRCSQSTLRCCCWCCSQCC